MSVSADKALKIWKQKGLLSEGQISELKGALSDGGHHVHRGVVIFSTIGAILVGLGILLFIGSNWKNMGPVFRLVVVFLGYAVCAGGAYVAEERKYKVTSEALWLLTTLVLGAGIFLVAQVFHFSLTYWQGPALWAIGALAMGYARQQEAHAFLAAPLVILAIGWFETVSGRGFGDQFVFLFSDDGLRALIPVIGIGFVSIGLLLRRFMDWSFVSAPWMLWGMLMITVPLVITTADDHMLKEFYQFDMVFKQWVLLALSAIVMFAAIGFGDTKNNETKGALVILMLVMALLLIQSGDQSLIEAMVNKTAIVFIAYIILVFLLAFGAIWLGLKTRNAHVLNFGILSVTILIIIQYFAWSFDLLDRSLAFILGGILLITLSLGVERKRRELLEQIK
ncbi:MAG: DUF2157 domain-containing protein [Candidatus Peribacteraceae bacterium]|jgi:uncharacterized membrane protein|nr:DUF2157 domain-containing protein [Candidatus Peribacteraceae bacterium]MDP7454339.1 DUF2157 domain-containing protein [Candidatus Peribacteraceae bacterium]MDP7645737.1 DUF2157 domain-containing protein [Candidatus Peribacteraceae bacterium]|tara:strand:- start:2305 stop:3486 length:1182 start_codon:yes stop_codon:yes gene_type:complete